MPARPLPWLLLATALAYLNVLAAGFQFDDFNVIVDNPAVHSLSAWWAGMPGIRPLLKLSYTLNWLLDPDPAGFHAVNVLLHLLNCVLVWRLSAHLPVPGDSHPGHRHDSVRLLAVLLFALHPIQTESVTYVSGRSMTLMASFALASLLCWLEADRQRRPWTWRMLAGLLYAAAVLSKEIAVVLPVLGLLFPARSKATSAWLALMLVGLVLSVLFMLLGYQRLLDPPLPRTLFSNLLSEANAIHYLLGQLIRPDQLNIDPSLPELTAWSAHSVAQVASLAGIAMLAWTNRQRWPWLHVSVFWFILLLLPMYSLIPRLDLASERHLYLASLGPFWLIAIGLSRPLAPRPQRLPVALLLLSLAGAAGVHLRNRDYRDEISLWRQTTRLEPHNARAWNNLGWAYWLAKRPEEARSAFENALRADPEHEKARSNLDMLRP